MDGVRKKAKYLHDAPDGALMPGVGGHYPYMNGNRPTPLPSQDTQHHSVSPQSNMYTQAQPTAFYAPNSIQGPLPVTQDARAFSNHQSPISPPFNQAHHGSVQAAPSTMAQNQQGQMQPFGPLFDPSDPALFNFDISSLNFGNHYGALEFGMLGHMSSGAGETPHDNGMMNPMNGAVNMYNQQMPASYADQSNAVAAMSFGPDGLPTGEWQDSQTRQGSMHVHTPNNTSANGNHDHGNHRIDSLNGPHAFAIGQGPASHSTASPASTDASAFDNDNPLATAAFFANNHRTHVPRSPAVNRSQQENRPQSTALRPLDFNGIRKRQRDTKTIYQDITKPYDYVKGYHRLYQLIDKRYSRPWVAKAQQYLQNYRPVLLQVREELNRDDLIHQEMGLQRNLMTLEDHFDEVGTPFLICRRSGEIVGINKEFTILTGWKRDVLLGHEPNLNINLGTNRDVSESEISTSITTPNLTAQNSETATPSVNIIELMDPKSALEYLQHFSELCYQDARGSASQRVNMLRYQTKADADRIQDTKNSASDMKMDPLIKMEGGAVHQGESAMQRLGAKNGMVDCMIWWHIKRDIFDMPVLVCMSVSHLAVPLLMLA
jgi:hypothetical protein